MASLQIFIIKMIDDVLGFTPQNKESYYFMLLVESIALSQSIKCEHSNQLKFLLFKGIQIFNLTKDPVSLHIKSGQKVKIEKVELTFFLKDANPNRKNDFILKLRENGNGEEKQIGSHTIFANQYIKALKDQGQSSIEKTAEIGPYNIWFRVFTDTNRFDLEKQVKSFKEKENQRVEKQVTEVFAQEQRHNEKIKQSVKQCPRNLALNVKKSIEEIKDNDNVKNKNKNKQEERRNRETPISPKSPCLGSLNTFGKARHSFKSNALLLKSEDAPKESVIIAPNPINIKLILFLLASLVLIIYAMTPSRKAFVKGKQNL